MIIWGSKGRISSKKADLLQGACPNCSGDLDLSDLKKWFTLYFIPVFPYSTVDTFYHCKKCESSYKTEARDALLGNGKEREQLKNSAIRMFFLSYVACATYMAIIDGEMSAEERAMIEKEIEEQSEFKEELVTIFNEIQTSDAPKEPVVTTLRKTSEILTSEGVLLLIMKIAELVLADGKIEDQEEKLMKEFMLIAGVSDSLYSTVIERVKKSA